VPILDRNSLLVELKHENDGIVSRGQKVIIAGFGRIGRGSPIREFRMTEVELYLSDDAGGRLIFASDDSAACSGDSGGPNFVFENGELVLIGVSSAATCDAQWPITVGQRT